MATAAPARRQDPSALRAEIRVGRFDGTTAGHCPGFAQANLVVLPRELAFDFLVFAQRNPKPCPVLEVLDPGDPEPRLTAPGADVRTDLPAYRVYADGELLEESRDLLSSWRDDAVAVLIGCSFTFEEGLLAADVPVRHLEQGVTVSMYRTAVECVPAGPFSGPLVVTMRPIPAPLVPRAVEVTARYPAVHGAPVHVGDPAGLGIDDLGAPDWGDPVEVRPGEVPVFWACGVTPQAVALASGSPWMLTHSPGRMMVLDVTNRDLRA
jgi:uncharacterized protein YcsI (UPF0317 family)